MESLREHQVEGIGFIEDKFRDHAHVISNLLTQLDTMTDAYKYEKEPVELALRTALANAGVMLAWEMGLGKTRAALEAHWQLQSWVAKWRREGWLHAKLAEKLSAPTLVVCPNTIKGVWASEYRKWGSGNPDIELMVFDTDKDIFSVQWALVAIGITKVAVMSYDTLKHRLDSGIKDHQWGLVIFDELQSVINPQAWVTQSVYQINSIFRLGLSGTPFTNKVDRLHGALSLLQGYTVKATRYDEKSQEEENYFLRRSPTWGAQEQFERDYVRVELGRRKKVIGGKNLNQETCRLWDCCKRRGGECKALHTKMAVHVMHRKRTEECLDLPPISWQDVEIPLTTTQNKLYDKLLSGVAGWLDSGEHRNSAGEINIANVMSQMLYAFELCVDSRQLAYSIANAQVRQGLNIVDYAGLKSSMFNSIKADETSAKLNWLRDTLDNGVDGKLLIFTEFAENARILAKDLSDYGVALMTGDESELWLDGYARRLYAHRTYQNSAKSNTDPRQQLVEAFQTDDRYRIFIGTQSAFEGITLTAASKVVLYGKVSWTPGKVYQAIKRAHRMGQDKPVTVFHLYAERTIEAWLRNVLARKQRDFDSAIDNGQVDRHSDLGIGNIDSIMDAFRGDIQ